jgi:hypothetical protein
MSRISRFYLFFSSWVSLTSKFQVLHDTCALYKCLIIQINPKVNLHWLRLGDIDCQQISPNLPIHVPRKHLIKLVQKICPKTGATPSTWKMWLGFSSVWGITHISGICTKAALVMVYLCGRRDQTLILHYITHSLSGCCIQAPVCSFGTYEPQIHHLSWITFLYTCKSLSLINTILSKEWLSASSISQSNYNNSYFFSCIWSDCSINWSL